MSFDEFNKKASKSISFLEENLKTIRTGKANTGLLENLMVEAYDSKVPLVEVASVSAPEPRLLVVSVWDKTILDNVVKSIKNSDLGLNPVSDGNLIRVNIPPMTEERRLDLVKLVRKLAEESRVALRNIRHEFLADLKRRQDEEKLPEGDVKAEQARVEAAIKSFNEQIDKIVKSKEDDLMSF